MYDFGKKFFADESEFNENPQTSLNGRIKKYIDDKHICDLAETCAWLANDFVHPIRRHPEKDLKELENFTKILFHHMNAMYVLYNSKSELEGDE